MKITITRALTEMKTLTDRIEKETINLDPIDIKIGDRENLMYSHKTEKDFQEKSKKQYQSLLDLMSRRERIKKAVILSNVTTKITVAGKEMTVAEAIEKKRSLAMDEKLLHVLRDNLSCVKRDVEKEEEKIERQISSAFTETAKGANKLSSEDYENIAKPIRKINQPKIITGFDVEKEIEKLNDSINQFKMEVDFCLSESNAKTEIDVD